MRQGARIVFSTPVEHITARKRPLMNPESASSTILHGRWLSLARAAWVAMAALTVGLFVAGIPVEFAQLQLGCPTPACASSGGLTPVELRLLENIGALNVKLSVGELAEIANAVPAGAVKGTRYPEGQMASLYI